MRQTGYLPRPPTSMLMKFCMLGRVRKVVIYFKFHESRLTGLGAVGRSKSPTPIDLAPVARGGPGSVAPRDYVAPELSSLEK